MRVACCVPRTRVADAAYNLGRDAAAGRARATRPARRSWSFPSWGCRPTRSTTCCCRTRCSTRSSASIAKVVEASNELCSRSWSSARRCGATGRLYNTRRRHPSRRDPGRRAEDLSAELPRVLRAAAFRLGRQRMRGGTIAAGGPRGAVRHRPAVPLDAARCRSPSMSRSARTSGCRCRRRARAALGRRRGAAQPVGQQHHHRQGRDAAAAVRAASRRAASRPTPIRPPGPANRPPTSPGTAMPAIYEMRRAARRDGALRAGSTIVIADVDLGRIRQERMRNEHASATARCRRADRVARFRTRRASRSTRRRAGVALERADRALPLRAVRSGQAARQLLRGLQHPGPGPGAAAAGDRRSRRLVIGVSGGLDSTQALIVVCAGDGPARPAARQHPGLHAAGLRAPPSKTHEQRLAADAGARRHAPPRSTSGRRPSRCWPISAIPSPRARRSTTSPSRTCRRACAPTTCSAWPTSIGGMVVGTGDLSELGLGWCTYGVGDHMSHYNPNGSVSKTLIQHLIRFVAASGDVDEETADDPARHPRHRDLARAGAGRRRRRDPVDRERRRPLRAAGFQSLLPDAATASGRRRSPSSPWNAWHDADKGAWPANTAGRRAARLYAGRDPALAARCSCGASSRNQFKRSALPNGPKISSGGSLSPRGDWRAPSDGSPDCLAGRA